MICPKCNKNETAPYISLCYSCDQKEAAKYQNDYDDLNKGIMSLENIINEMDKRSEAWESSFCPTDDEIMILWLLGEIKILKEKEETP